MRKFDNLETTLISKWFNSELDTIINSSEAKKMSELDLISFVSENIEELIKEELSVLTEGYISEIVGESFTNIDYRDLISYYKN